MPFAQPAADRARAVLLAALATAFLARVVGQLVVALATPGWLPPMAEWYSGQVPYPLLLPIQLVILALQAKISWDLWRGRGVFTWRRPRFGLGLRWFSLVYLAAMVARYAITMGLHPERRWLGGAIPIFFHWVLAAYCFVWSRYHTQPAELRG